MSKLGEHYSRYSKLTIDESNKEKYDSNNYKTVFLTDAPNDNLEYEKTEKYLVVNSRDRDVSIYPSSSKFVINLDQEYRNISSVELIQAIVPDKNNVTLEPYLLLNINELENTMDSNNKEIFEAFAILQTCPATVTNSFLHIDKRIFENVILHYKTPKANLSKLTISITDSEGGIFDFGGSGSTNKANQCLFVFKLTILDVNRKSINQRNVY